MDFCQEVSSWFWSESFWLPLNLTWKDVEPTEQNNFANFYHLFYPLAFAVIITIVREILERYILSNFGRYLGLKDTKKRVSVENVVLEKAYKANNHVTYKKIQGLAKQINWSERQIERWLRQRVLQDKPSTLKKFTECGYRFAYYLLIFIYEVYVLWDKPWAWDTKHCWVGFPKQTVTPDVWWLYMISLSFYWSLTISQFWDVKRKDFLVMFVHHLSTILLLSFSWTLNLTRMGCLVLIIHDCADIFIEAAKMARYSDKERLCNVLFAIFTLIWIISRLGFYPYIVLYSTLYEGGNIIFEGTMDYMSYPPYYIINGLLCILQVLHAVWTFFIMRVLVMSLSAGKVVKDERSNSSNQSSDGRKNS